MHKLNIELRQELIELWQCAVDASLGEKTVFKAMQAAHIDKADMVIAVGKAAASMALGALKILGDDETETLIISKYSHGLDELKAYKNVTLLEAAHPIPDQNSLDAGFALLNKVKSLSDDCKLVFLVSGGASSLVEYLAEGLSLFDLQMLNQKMISDGLPIGEMNKKRRQLSQIKFGKLLSQFNGTKLDIFYISDVEGDDLSVIGSGIGFYDADLHLLSAHKPQVSSYNVASNAVARNAVAAQAVRDEFKVIYNQECLYDDIFNLAPQLAKMLIAGERGVYIFGGEPTVNLPRIAGNGGRNQSLGLAIAQHIYGHDDIIFIVAGTDGTDGPTKAAGAIIDGTTFSDAVAGKAALKAADAGTYLAQHDALYTCGPTGTNVMDVIIAIKS